jgi:hypothetical protein
MKILDGSVNYGLMYKDVLVQNEAYRIAEAIIRGTYRLKPPKNELCDADVLNVEVPFC